MGHDGLPLHEKKLSASSRIESKFIFMHDALNFGVTSKGCWNPHKTYLSKCFLEFLILNSQNQGRNN